MSIRGGSKSRGQAQAEAVDLAKFLHEANPEEVVLNAVADGELTTRYLEKLRSCQIGPSGQQNKLRTIRKGVRYLVSLLPEEPTENESKLLYRCTKQEASLTSTIQGLNKEKNSLMARKKDLRVSVHGTDSHQTKDNVDKLLMSPQTRARMEQILEVESPTEASKCLLRRYLVCTLVFQNAQRPGAVTGMRLDEFEGAMIVSYFAICANTCVAYYSYYTVICFNMRYLFHSVENDKHADPPRGSSMESQDECFVWLRKNRRCRLVVRAGPTVHPEGAGTAGVRGGRGVGLPE